VTFESRKEGPLNIHLRLQGPWVGTGLGGLWEITEALGGGAEKKQREIEEQNRKAIVEGPSMRGKKRTTKNCPPPPTTPQPPTQLGSTRNNVNKKKILGRGLKTTEIACNDPETTRN